MRTLEELRDALLQRYLDFGETADSLDLDQVCDPTERFGYGGRVAIGQTDELGFHAIENRHYVTDVHATLLHLLGLDPRRLAVPGRKRLERELGHPIREIIS